MNIAQACVIHQLIIIIIHPKSDSKYKDSGLLKPVTKHLFVQAHPLTHTHPLGPGLARSR